MEREVSFLSLFPDYEPEDEQRALLPGHYSWDAVRKDWLGLYE